MNYGSMSKEELIKEIEKLNKKLYHKVTARLSWKKIMNGKLVKGPGYWSNGHFALKNEIAIPDAVSKLKDLYPSETDVKLETFISGPADRKLSDRQRWVVLKEDGLEKIITEKAKFQKLYIDVLGKLVPGFTLHIAEDNLPATIEKDGVFIGLLMPLK